MLKEASLRAEKHEFWKGERFLWDKEVEFKEKFEDEDCKKYASYTLFKIYCQIVGFQSYSILLVLRMIS